jgi:YidC/Oxa1 family membrane protein insertase
MSNIFYTLIIFPIEQIIELCYVFALRLTKSPGLSIIGLSMIVSTLILPIYIMAENKQKAEREKQKQMKEKIDKIKAVFKGDERYMLLSTLYRQNNYHPIYALRNSLDLFIQIPFFIAAYHFLYNLELLNGQAFKFIRDLGAPDRLLGSVNICPILMTVINCVSGAIYAKGLQLKDKIQIYGIALVFLVLLYNSPAALVLYWTCNNIYNLSKNIVIKNDKLKKYIYPAVILLLCFFIAYILLFSDKIGILKRIAILFSAILIILLTFRNKIKEYCSKKINLNNLNPKILEKQFFLTLLGLMLLIGMVIPSKLIASSAAEFSYLKPNISPLPFLFTTFLQSAGISLWLLCIFYLFKSAIIKPLTIFITIISFIFLSNTLFFNGNYGIMSPDLHFRIFVTAPITLKILNIFIDLFLGIIIFFIFKYNKSRILFIIQSAITISLLCVGIINIYRINSQFNKIEINITSSSPAASIEKLYTFTKTGKNLLIIVTDRAMSLFMPVILEEKPELNNIFTGFTYYPNTLSSGRYTIYGMPSIFGGYYYTPAEINKRPDETLLKKYTEALQVLPRIMANAGFNVSTHNQQKINEEHYADNDNIKMIKYQDYYDYFIANNPDFILKDYKDILFYNLIRYSFFECSPVIFHNILYDKGDYLSLTSSKKINTYQKETISTYSDLYYLPESTKIIDSNINQALMIVNDVNIYDAIFSMPDYYPSNYPLIIDKNLYSKDSVYHTNIASIFLISKYMDFLKENGVYDNTRIIIVSDHGRLYREPLQSNILFSDYFSLADVNALLMVKDFNSSGQLNINNSFMTNADVPHIAVQGLVQNPVNPFTGKELPIIKNSGFMVTSSIKHNLEEHSINSYNIEPDKWLDDWFLVKDNIFNPANWSKVTINE